MAPKQDEPENVAEASSSPEAMRQELVGSFQSFELGFRRHYPLLWLFTLLAPLILTTVALVVIGLVSGWDMPAKYLSHAFATFFVFGRFIILVGVEGDAAEKFQVLLSPLQLFGMVTFMDFVTALFVTFHMGVLFRLPWVGEKIAMLVWDGKFIMDSQPWIKRIAFFGLVLFVIFPTSTTGSIGGSIFGRMLGLSRWLTVSGVLLGSLLGNGLMYAFAKSINRYIGPDNVWLWWGGIAVIVAVVVFAERRYRMVKQRYMDRHLKASEQSEQLHTKDR